MKNKPIEPMTEEEFFSRRNRWYVFCEVMRDLWEMIEKIEDSDLRNAIKSKILLGCGMIRIAMKKIREHDPYWVMNTFMRRP